MLATSEFLPIDSEEGFGSFGGSFVAETLVEPLEALKKEFAEIQSCSEFEATYLEALKNFVGRPTPLTFADRLTREVGGAKIYLKREDLNHTGAHKINNVIGQMLLSQRMGKRKIIAETGAGQHGVATATVAARMGLQCQVFMGARDAERQKANVFRMRVLGAEVVAVEEGSATLKDAINAALRQWVAEPESSFYLIGSALGPHPYPKMVKHFQSVIGREAKKQILELEGEPPSAVVACVGGGSNAIGIFSSFIADESVKLYGVEAAGAGVDTAHHSSRFAGGQVGVFQGTKTIFLQDQDGQSRKTQSIAAGMDYTAIGPEHAFLQSSGRVDYTAITDREALEAFHRLSKLEGIIPALESSHALAYAERVAKTLPKDRHIIVNVSGRGDKDLDQIFSDTASGESHDGH